MTQVVNVSGGAAREDADRGKGRPGTEEAATAKSVVASSPRKGGLSSGPQCPVSPHSSSAAYDRRVRAQVPASVAVAESCTGGLTMAKLVAIPGAGEWFHGGVAAYEPEVKFDILSMKRGPVVTSEAAMQMATGIRRLVGADLAVSSTGVAGPDTEEGQPVGPVFLGLDVAGGGQQRRGVPLRRLTRRHSGEAAERALGMIFERLDTGP